MKKVEELTQEDIRELITYDPISGKAFWNKRDVKWFRESGTGGSLGNSIRWNNKNAGKEIINKNAGGYIYPCILRVHFLLHRVIYLYMTGEWPLFIDHINGIRDDNRWCNLRNVTKQENCKNRALHSKNLSGYHGVNKYKGNNKWQVKINDHNGENRFLGSYESLEEAISVRKKAEVEYGYSPTHGRSK